MATTRVLSKQDGTQSASTIITSRAKLQRDIDLSFTAKPNGDLYLKKDAAAVTQALKNLIQTNFMEKPFLPNYGANLRAMLFELADDDTEEEMAEQIMRTISAFEPRAKVVGLDVTANQDQNSVSVTIDYQVVNTDEVISFTTSISRLR